MRLIARMRDCARVGALLVLALWFAFYRPAGILGGTAGYVLVEGRSMLPTYRTGDLVVAIPRPAYRPGDIVVFTVPAGEPGAGGRVIHRVVRVEPNGSLVTRGDNNGWDDTWRPMPANVLGTPEIVLPGAGPLLAFFRIPFVAGSVAALAFIALASSFSVPTGPGRGGKEVYAADGG